MWEIKAAANFSGVAAGFPSSTKTWIRCRLFSVTHARLLGQTLRYLRLLR